MKNMSGIKNMYVTRHVVGLAALIIIAGSQPAIAKKAPLIPFPPVEHTVSGNQSQIFQATIAALEDNGLIINNVDSNSGFVRASTPVRDTRDFFENITGEAEYKSTSATVTMIPNNTGAYTLRLRLVNNRTESQSGFGDFDQSGEQKFEKIDRSLANYTRIFELIDARLANMKNSPASLETASGR